MKVLIYTLSGKLIRPRQILAFSLDESLFVPAAALDLTISDMLDECAGSVLVYDGEKLLFDGFVDRQQVMESAAAGGSTRIRARSRGALLLDNEARPQTYQRTTARDIFERHLKPHGFTRIVGHRQELGSFVVGKGMTEWEVLLSFLEKTTGAYPRLLPDGTVNIETYLKSERRVHLSNTRPGAVRYTGYEIRYDRHAPIEKILIENENGFYTTCVRNPAAIEAGISRRKYQTTPKEYADAPVRNAKLRIRESMRDYFTVRVTAAAREGIDLLDLCFFGPLEDGKRELIVTGRTLTLGPKGWEISAVLQDKSHLEIDLSEGEKEGENHVVIPKPVIGSGR
ncbi:hypothetical protein [Zongyangia hominis]|uniref:Uncharacterized protein n=1 Tax=Zongyangia hominis TaxID=2763677 RepID=A0A926E9R5_9FIRM|nr:hypothetical protein [Zongyangia hominis]MBC8570530.1 hypothetical protein [Zongyangia hominis]